MRPFSWAEDARDSVELAREYERQGIEDENADIVDLCLSYSREEWARAVGGLLCWVSE